MYVMEDSKMKKHVTVVGAIHIGFGILGLIAAGVVFFGLSIAKGLVSDEEVPVMVLNILSITLPVLIGFMSSLGVIGGIGILSYKTWARYLIIVVAAIGCVNIPIGTLKGVYTLWVLLQDDSIKLFEQK